MDLPIRIRLGQPKQVPHTDYIRVTLYFGREVSQMRRCGEVVVTPDEYAAFKNSLRLGSTIADTRIVADDDTE